MYKKDQQHWIKLLKDINEPTPFMVTDLNIARQNVKKLQQHLPEVKILYAVKSNADPKLIKAISDDVYGYDVASFGEIKMLQKNGISIKNAYYSNPVKIPEHIKKSYKIGVKKFAFDSIDEIKKISKYAPGSDVYLRLKVSDYGSRFPLSKKFGVDPLHAVAYMDTAVAAGLNPYGLAFHVGSQSENPHTWAVAFETCGKIINKLEKNGIKIKMLNIGGGFPATYTDRITTPTQLSRTIRRAIKKNIPDDVQIVAEPGRFISATTSVIVSSVIAREERSDNDWLFLDMGVFQGLMESLQMSNWYYPIFTDYGRKAAAFSQSYVLTGPTCDAYDTIGLDYQLPSTLKMGDRIYIGSAGAYTTAYASSFNGFEPPKTIYVNNGIE